MRLIVMFTYEMLYTVEILRLRNLSLRISAVHETQGLWDVG